ncbi:MAG: VanZ family protein [Ignavibacteriales bacterium]|nr:VanZ family protein [Ignavibacteriales bacterium]
MYKFLEKNKIILIYIPLVVYWIVLLVATSLPGRELPNLGISDKLEHFAAYTILAILLCFTYLFQSKFKFLNARPYLFTLLTAILYGSIDEIHQLFIPGRACDIRDLTADSIGGIIGIIIVYIISRFNFEHKVKPANTR